MWEFIGFTALVVSIVAVALVKGCRRAIKTQQADLDDLWQKLANIEKSSHKIVEGEALRPAPEILKRSSAVHEVLRHKAASAPPPAEPAPEIKYETLDAFVPAPEEQPVQKPAEPLLPRFDRESWAKLEQKLGKQWITWIGAVVLFLAAGLFVKYLGEGDSRSRRRHCGCRCG